MTMHTIRITSAVWGVIIGALLGQFANRIIAAYDKSFTKESLKIAFMLGLIIAIGWHTWIFATVGASILDVGLGIVTDTMVLGVMITGTRAIWDIVSEAAKNAWSVAKTWSNSFMFSIREKTTGLHPDTKGNKARATVGVV